ncbi:putative Phosphatidylinositol 4-kinase type II subunit alpha [Taphrina deformans PYCC 5710]|uniref:Phosphatidylinositol 4-kinase n=1 Tax=Taphrina deformans (strain PYCC 5710 / ATCC 11124 / CBS 356.35 / IMI 108563 / JCM 9778 / NBRC 8474) TaxID=1097556 RepID=R4XCH8_TAPDE|nr:putative Phosphatidylinositol 4-kinase type II subunit alpha [Taphrina deformans PYCC 5710]|eukprot:CCG81025.1 putative Phosphatidylinositol 4-kinase type II subunit alpha [Taphrina deformans PYCC 5710]
MPQQYTRLGQHSGDEDGHAMQEESNMLDNIVDLKQINAHLQDWFTKIKVKQPSKKDFDVFSTSIHSSVFTPKIPKPSESDGDDSATGDQLSKSITTTQFDHVIDSVKEAISRGIQPRLVTKGSSGSYFALNKQQKIVGIFKPKNEEPYGQLNPKWTKWLHRNLFPCFFGRSCLIPNLSYISEAAACLLDRRLESNIVPPTDVVWLSSTSFNYDYFDRRAYSTKGRPLPAKQGSFQVFLEGYQDATEFLREHPWPDSSIRHETVEAQRSAWMSCVGSNKADSTALADIQSEMTSENPAHTLFWTEDLMQGMREELEKLVILDYIMRNTDRGLDNWMLKVSPSRTGGKSKVEIVASTQTLQTDVISKPPGGASMSQSNERNRDNSSQMSLGAIDNSLAFPWKHPDEWRSFPFGWLFLPASLIGQPFSAKTRQHFLPLLSDPEWWCETTSALKKLFSQDADFQEKMFAKQMAVLKGQAWNVLETLKSGDQGPLELARRPRLHVWTDIMEVPVTVPTKQSSNRGPGDLKKSVKFSESDEIDLGMAVSVPNVTSNPFLDEIPEQGLLEQVNDDPERNSPSRQRPHELYAGSRSYLSYEEPRSKTATPKIKSRSRGMSLSMKSNRFFADEESDLGDLGFALMHDEESSTRRVVVERLETVHGAEAVFSWC